MTKTFELRFKLPSAPNAIHSMPFVIRPQPSMDPLEDASARLERANAELAGYDKVYHLANENGDGPKPKPRGWGWSGKVVLDDRHSFETATSGPALKNGPGATVNIEGPPKTKVWVEFKETAV